ncbi:MAG: hypothetical protein K6343_00585 [Caldisericaceae bacterium]
MEAIKDEVILTGVMLRKEMNTYFVPKEGLSLSIGDFVIIERNNISTLGKVVRPLVKMEAQRFDKLKERFGTMRLLRKADENDFKYFKDLAKREDNAFKICKEKIKTHNLPMHLVETIWDEKEKEFVFYFTASSRVDFRELIKDLVQTLNSKIKLWQVGSRDAMKFFGGIGPCGYPVCCTNFLRDVESIELAYAKMQNLSMNTSKITGLCGKLMCCLKYELNKNETVTPDKIEIMDVKDEEE